MLINIAQVYINTDNMTQGKPRQRMTQAVVHLFLPQQKDQGRTNDKATKKRYVMIVKALS